MARLTSAVGHSPLIASAVFGFSARPRAGNLVYESSSAESWPLGERVRNEISKCPLLSGGAVVSGDQHVCQTRNWVSPLGGCWRIDDGCPKVLRKCIGKGVDGKSGAGWTGNNKFARLVLN